VNFTGLDGGRQTTEIVKPEDKVVNGRRWPAGSAPPSGVVGRPAHRPGGVISISERFYARLLALYPARYRREYGPLMRQLFRDLLRETYMQNRGWAQARLWLRVAAELGVTAGREHAAEIERLIMEANAKNGTAIRPASVFGLLFAAVIIAGGLLAKVFILEFGGTVAQATAVAITLNLAGALIMERAMRTGGYIVAGVALLITTNLLPLLWVSDGQAWLRENPINGFIIILVAAWTSQGRPRWPILAAAAILGAAQIVVSFI
jgi:hypothetical protein